MNNSVLLVVGLGLMHVSDRHAGALPFFNEGMLRIYWWCLQNRVQCCIERYSNQVFWPSPSTKYPCNAKMILHSQTTAFPSQLDGRRVSKEVKATPKWGGRFFSRKFRMRWDYRLMLARSLPPLTCFLLDPNPQEFGLQRSRCCGRCGGLTGPCLRVIL